MKSITLEQDASLNQYLPPPSNGTIAAREFTIIIGAFSFPFIVLTGTMKLLGNWFQNKPLDLIPIVTLCVFGYIGFLLLATLSIQFSQWIYPRQKRSLRLHKSGVSAIPGTYFSWENLHGWHLETLADHPGLTKLTLLYARHSYKRQWSIILATPEQIAVFRNHLEERKKDGKESPAQIPELPLLPVAKEIRPLGCLLVSTGLTLFVLSAFPLILAVWIVWKPNVEFNRSILKESEGNLETFILDHFGSSHEMGWTIICAGLLITLLALALAIIGQRYRFKNEAPQFASAKPT